MRESEYPARDPSGTPKMLAVDASGRLITAEGGAAVVPPATATVSSVNSGVASVVALASNVNRRGAIFTNDDANQARLLFGAGTASATNYSVTVAANGGSVVLENGEFTGAVQVIWDGDGSGALRVTEFTA